MNRRDQNIILGQFQLAWRHHFEGDRAGELMAEYAGLRELYMSGRGVATYSAQAPTTPPMQWLLQQLKTAREHNYTGV